MKLLNFSKKGNETRIGIKTSKGILDLKALGERFNVSVPESMEQLMKENRTAEISSLMGKAEDAETLPEEEITFEPVMKHPEKIVCVGLNYAEHAEEAGTKEVPKEPVLFSKFNNALAAHNENIPLPNEGQKFDYEAELVIIMGKEARNVSKEDALSYVFGYSVGNDLSIRDLQFKSGQWLLGKTADKFAPVGPYVVTADEVDPANLDISLKRNGKTVQSSNTKHMIFNCEEIISYVSRHMTLKPGDLIFTGTPEGVVLGYPENDQDWLKPGEELEVTIENIGTLKNRLTSVHKEEKEC